MKKIGFGLLLAIFFPAIVRAVPVTQQEVDMAQAKLIKRIEANIEKYAERIGIDSWYILYCRGKMSIETSLYPANGLIPFGVDYRTISDSDRLELVINNREAFETGYIQLCLASAKTTLSAAEAK